MKTSMHLKVAALIAHVALCTAVVLEVAQPRAVDEVAALPLYHPDHR